MSNLITKIKMKNVFKINPEHAIVMAVVLMTGYFLVRVIYACMNIHP